MSQPANFEEVNAADLNPRRWAILGVFVAAAILTPPDPVSQIMMALPTLLLYEGSILAVAYVEKQKAEKEAAETDA